MAIYRVALRVQGDHLAYDLDDIPPVVELGPEDALVVTFADIPPHYVPAFSALHGAAPFGPFLTVQVEESSLCCQGCGHVGTGTFDAWPLLVSPTPDDPPLAPANPFEVRLVDGAVRHVRQVHVTILNDDDVVVSPGDIEQIFAGSVVEWLFHFADPDHPPRLPVIAFHGHDNLVGSVSGLGPFSALRVNAFHATEGVRFRVIGSGNNGIGGSYHYGVGVIDPVQPGAGWKRLRAVDRYGKVVDPIIDNTGGPP